MLAEQVDRPFPVSGCRMIGGVVAGIIGAGLTNFLIFHDGGRYRDAVVSYLSAVYTGRDNRDTLARLTGANYAELDEQYREFLEGKKATAEGEE